MKQISVFLGMVLVTGSFMYVVVAQTSNPAETTTTEGPVWGMCADGSELIAAPECPPDDDPSKPVYFPFPYDCRQYFECTNGRANCIRCPLGTVWDQSLTVCNHEAAVKCIIVTTPAPDKIPAESVFVGNQRRNYRLSGHVARLPYPNPYLP